MKRSVAFVASVLVGIIVLTSALLITVAPVDATGRGGRSGGFHGGGFHGGSGFHGGRGFQHGFRPGFHHGGFHRFGCCFGPAFVGGVFVGSAFAYPYYYAYPYYG